MTVDPILGAFEECVFRAVPIGHVVCANCGRILKTDDPPERCHAICRNASRRVPLPGDKLRELITLLEMQNKNGCQACDEMLRKMNTWGPSGCREHRAE